MAIALCIGAAVALSWVRLAVAGTMRVDQSGLPLKERIAFLALFGLLAAGAVYGYFALLRNARASQLGRLFRGALGIHLLAFFALPFTSNDLFSNLAYGRMIWAGLNPYFAGPHALGVADPFLAWVGARWSQTPSVYGPVVTALDALASAAGHVTWAAGVFKLEMLACALLSVALAFLWARSRGDSGARAFALLAFNPLFIWEISAQAHNDAVLVLALVGFVWAIGERREWPALGFLALGFYAKFSLAPVVGLWLWQLFRRDRRKALAMGIALGLAGVIGYAPFWQGLATFHQLLHVAAGSASHTTHSLIDAAMLLGEPFGPQLCARLYAALSATADLVLVVVAARALLRTRTESGSLRHALIFLFAWALLVPWFQPWYALWLLPLAIAADDPRLTEAVVWFTTLNLVAYVLPIDPASNIMINLFVLARLFRKASAAEIAPAESAEPVQMVGEF